MTPHIDAEAAAQAILDLRNEPPPTEGGGGGCTLASLIVVVLLLGMPVLVRASPIPNQSIVMIAAVLGFIGLTSAVIGFSGGRNLADVLRGSCEGAADALRAGLEQELPSDQLAPHAVQILEHCRIKRRDVEEWAFAPHEAEEYLGDAWPFVIETERALLTRGLISPTYTDGLKP